MEDLILGGTPTDSFFLNKDLNGKFLFGLNFL